MLVDCERCAAGRATTWSGFWGCFHVFSAGWDRWVLNAGGGPVEVSIPWLLRDAGGLLFAGERGSKPDEASCWTKYPVDCDGGADNACGNNGDEVERRRLGLPDVIAVVIGIVAMVKDSARWGVFRVVDDALLSTILAKEGDWLISSVSPLSALVLLSFSIHEFADSGRRKDIGEVSA